MSESNSFVEEIEYGNEPYDDFGECDCSICKSEAAHCLDCDVHVEPEEMICDNCIEKRVLELDRIAWYEHLFGLLTRLREKSIYEIDEQMRLAHPRDKLSKERYVLRLSRICGEDLHCADTKRNRGRKHRTFKDYN